LHIRETGQDYTLRFIARKLNGDLVADVFSDPFDVVVGEPYKLAFQTHVGTSFGGEPFANSPAVAIVDRGGNIVPDSASYIDPDDTEANQIRAVLTACPRVALCPTTAALEARLQPTANTVATITEGVATFEGLYLNDSGYPYQITFYSSLVRLTALPSVRIEPTLTSVCAIQTGLAANSVASGYFAVNTGVAAKMAFVDGYNLAFSPKYSGEFFTVPPRLRLLDAGGNFVSTDNSSALEVSIRHNPTGRARIGPAESTFVVARQGVVSFNALHIDTTGYNYTLQFLLYLYSPLAQGHISTGFALTSEKFDVAHGPARKLVLAPQYLVPTATSARGSPSAALDTYVPGAVRTVGAAGGAWAGNQAFVQQPVLQLQDYGGTPRTPDSTSVITAWIVPSLSVGSGDILIDTSAAPQTAVSDITIALADGQYGAGHVIDILVHFPVNVWVISANSTQLANATEPESLPYIVLDLTQSASAEPPLAELVGRRLQTKVLTFRYVVQPGDSSAALPLEVVSASALVLNRTRIVDGNSQDVNITLPLPHLSVAQSVVVNTAAPVATALTTSTTDGNYGPGQAIELAVTFDLPVSVEGRPYLLLNAANASGAASVAVYTHSTADDTIVHFLYTVRDTDTTSGGNLQLSAAEIRVWNATANDTMVSYNETLGYHYDYAFSNKIAGSIRRRADRPTTQANYDLTAVAAAFSAAHAMVVDATPPALDASYGVQTTHADGVLYPGEHVYLTIAFDRPVAVSGVGIHLVMDAGPHGTAAGDYAGRAYISRLLSDNVTLEFLYIVEQYTNTTQLDVTAGAFSLVVPGDTAYIRRLSTAPSLAADVTSTVLHASAMALRNNANLQVLGYAPYVISTTLVSTVPVSATVLYPDDSALIQVVFSAPVVTTCAPVLVIAARYFREAQYVSGSGTDTLLFRYTVQMGDTASALQYRHTPYALCAVTGCPQRSSCSILAESTEPSLPVDMRLARPHGVDYNGGVTFAAGAAVSSALPTTRGSGVTQIASTDTSGEYGAGSALLFEVTFTDTVTLTNTSANALPRLYLNIGRYATYAGGNRSPKLVFRYITSAADVLTSGELLPALIGATGTAIHCLPGDGCGLLNQAGRGVDLITSTGIFASTGITLDPTPPVVTSVYTDKRTSTYSGAEYSVGECIRIIVQVSKAVVVTGFDPRIEMNVSQPERYALYNASLSTPTKLVFVYTVQHGDASSQLQYAQPYIDLYGGFCVIYRQSSVPTTVMDVTLPDPFPLATVGNTVTIDGMQAPRVTNVSSIDSVRLRLTDGVIYAGDSVILRVDFDREVIAVGNSYLTLNLGDHVRRAYYAGYREEDILAPANRTADPLFNDYTAVQPNMVSNATRHLYYVYTVEEGDIAVDLEYADVFSLQPGTTTNNDPGYIVHASSQGKLLADLELAKPGFAGSLSADSTVLRVDGRRPYITVLQYLTPPGTYGTTDTVLIAMNFSAPVVVSGVPTVKLETGLVDNKASYQSGSGTEVLIFAYTPEPGDFSTDLDYHGDRARFLSAKGSFLLNGGSILAMSAQPYLPADIWLNPPRGALKGDNTSVATTGTAHFQDLHIDARGPDYQLRFTASVPETDTVLTVTQQPLDVSFSAERQLRPASAIAKHRIGEAVDIDGDIAVVGCPNCNSSVTTIMAVVTSAAEGIIQREVQLLQTTVIRQPAKQSFHTSAAVGSKVGGGFRLLHGNLGPTALIPANADYAILAAALRADIPSLGNVTVSREPYIFCACDNAFTWTLTFHDITAGQFAPMTLDGSGLTGVDAQILGPTIVQAPAFLGGTFTLSAVNKTTSPVPVNAGVARITAAFAELGIPMFDILISPTEDTGARTWSITFDAYKDSYQMPLIETDGAGLTGGLSTVFIQLTRPGRHGPFGIAGYFALSWRGNTTEWLRPNTSAVAMKAALEALPVINYVNVNRTVDPVMYGYTWTIEFVSVNVNTPRGLVLQDTSNLEPLEPVNQLIATDPVIEVQARYALGTRNQITGIARQGTFGWGAGAVHVYQRRNETWDELATLRGNDTAENNRFGGAVALYGDTLLVGAIGGNMNGRPEKQAIYCSATNGTFVIKFRGWSTAPISYNVTHAELLQAILSDSRIFDKLYTVTALDISEWGGGALCNNNTALLTFYSPVDGAKLLLGQDTGANLELLQFDTDSFAGEGGANAGFITATEVQAGTWRLHNVNSDPQQIGSAYIFRAQYDCADPTSELCRKTNWTQEALLFPTTSRVGSRFGTAVALGPSIAVIGAPGSFDEKGVAYAFEYSASAKRWNFLQVITYPLIVAGDNFGTTVALSGDTLVVAASRFQSGTGGVFTFTRPPSGGAFIGAQSLIPSPSLFTLKPGDNFGSGLAVEGNLLVVGAPGYSDRTVYFGDQRPAEPREHSGAVFVFERVSPAFNFRFTQRLNPSAVQEFDGFGHNVDLDGTNLVASSLQDGTATAPDKPVVEVLTHASYAGEKLGGSFKLRWLTESNLQSRTTRFIMHDTTADALRQILEADLRTGPLLVTRSRVDVYDGGYSWSITFLDYDVQVPLFEPDITLLTGLNADVTVRYINPSPAPLRGKAHVFQKLDTPFGNFIEQMMLSPYVHQVADRCGQSARISGTYAIVGCPNRDQRVPSQNSGAAFVYHLGLLAVQWDGNFTVLEGNTAPVSVVHNAINIADVQEDLLFYTETVDRNAFSKKQRFIQHLFGIPGPTDTYPDSMLDRTLLVGKATARAQFYGSGHNESQWVDGMYDYRAISDYVPVKTPQVLLLEGTAAEDMVVTTPDSITETPDEYVVLGITAPGIWPSVFGRLYGQLRIYDPTDGNIWGEPRFRKLYDTTTIETEGISRVSTAASVFSSSTDTVSAAEEGSEYGHSVGYCESLGVMAVGVPEATVNGRAHAGKVVLYHRDAGGNWTQDPTYITSPVPLLKGKRFGDAVALSRVYERNMSILAVGEPSLNKIHVYISEGANVGDSYTLDATLTWNDADGASPFTVSQRAGERGTIALHGFLLVVAAPALESAWVYRRIYDETTTAWSWSTPVRLRSTDYDYDVIQGASYLHRQDFGHAVAVNSRTVLVGAPFADYDNIGIRDKFGANLVETQWNTEGTSILSFARGRAYVYYSAPSSQEVRIRSPERLYYGDFQLNYYHQGINATTVPLRFDAQAWQVKEALMALPNVDDVEVSAESAVTDEGVQYVWTLAFVSDWQDEPSLLRVFHHNHGCRNCTAFSAIADNTSAADSIVITTTLLSTQTPLTEVQTLSAGDKRHGDRFGAAVALDGDQIVVGAPFSATMTTTTWDFEAGTLLGWHRTGDAFNYQPTFGDNSYLRAGHKGRQSSARLRASAHSSGLEGLYYIGTFEKRPGDAANYRVSDPMYPEGSTQGDLPRGTLSSEVFIVRGDSISFLIGGGCDVYTEYVELIVDGLSVGKHTGQCAEKMRPVTFDTSRYLNRAAQIRIVDNSTANWGHINVDSIKFSWDVSGASVRSANKKVSHGGVTETPLSGAAYIYRRVQTTADVANAGDGAMKVENCGAVDKSGCLWTQEVKVTASDKRPDMQFGAAVAVNDHAGVVLVGAPHAPFTGFYKEVPSVFPYVNASDYSTAAALHFAADPANMLLFQSAPAAVPERSGAAGVWTLAQQELNRPDPRPAQEAGALYAFVKQHQKLYADGSVAVPQTWSAIEHSKLQPPDDSARDRFATSFAYDGMSVVVGAPGEDGMLFDAGASYIYSTEFTALSFSAVRVCCLLVVAAHELFAHVVVFVTL
jgi:hypothetical protein